MHPEHYPRQKKNYHLHSGKLEFLALKWAVTERFADYLRYGPPFTVYTDNNPLTYILTTAKLNAVGQRWVNDLADFQFTMKYKPGKTNIDADYFSRRPTDIAELRRNCSETLSSNLNLKDVLGVDPRPSPVMCAGVSVDKLSLDPDGEIVTVSLEELQKEQQTNEVTSPVYRAVLAGSRPSRKEWKELSRGSKLLMRNFGKLAVKNGVLVRKTAKYVQVVLPEKYHDLVFVELHQKMAHLGVEKVVDLAQQRFYWPRMADDIKNFIQKKCRCVANKKLPQAERAPLQPIQATHPFQMVSVDFMHLDTCKGNYKYAMAVTDHFTRFVQIYATKTKNSKAAADKLFNEYIMQFGYPERIHHDRGPEFNSRLFEQMHRVTRIRASNTTPYHPMGDGQVERFNRTICNMLRSLSANAKKDWRSYLPKLAFAYNATVNKATGYSPHFLMFGREARLPIDMVFEEVRSEGELDNKSHEQFVKQWTERMQEAMEIASLPQEY